MWNFIKILLISLLVLSGCSQPPSSESSRQAVENNSTDQNITSRTVQVLVGLGGTQRSNQRALGSYQDVTAVVLSYSDPDNVTTSVDMARLNGIWSANITLSAFGSYEFQAIARNSSGTTIFGSASPVSEEVTPETTALNLSLQMIAVEVDSAFVPPKITQLTIPQTYLPDTEVSVDFQVEAATDDLLKFTLEVVDGTGTLINTAEDNSTTYTPDTTSGNALYDGSMSIFVGTEPSPMTFTFTAYSVQNSYAVHARFTIQQANQSAAPVLQFMPTIDTFHIGSEKLLNVGADSSLIFDLEVADYGADYSNAIKFMPDNTTIETSLDYTNGTRISGTFSRSDPNIEGSLSITFIQSTTQFSVTYDIPIPAGQTVFTEVGGTIGSCGLDCPVTPPATLSGIDGSVVDLHYWDYFQFAPQGTHDLTTDGSARIYLEAWDNGESEGSYDIQVKDQMGTVVWDSNSDEYEFYLPAGTYTIAFTPIGTINNGGAVIEAYPVHALEDDAGNMVAANQGIDGGITFLANGATDTRNIYFNNHAGNLVIVQDINSEELSLSLLHADGTPVIDNNENPIASATGELFLGSTHDFYLPSGDYQLQIQNNTGADWNGRLVAYQAYDTSVKVTTPDGINYYSNDSVYMPAPSASALVVNQCTQEAREVGSMENFVATWPITYTAPCNDTSLYYDIDLSNLPAEENYLLDFTNYGNNASNRMLWIEDSNGTTLVDETGTGNSNGLVMLNADSPSSFQYKLTGGEIYKWAIRNGTGDQTETNTSLDLSFQAEFPSDPVFVVDVSQQCMNGQEVRVYDGDPQDLSGMPISSTDDYGNTIVTSANCIQPFQMVVTAGGSLDFYLYWPRVVVDTGTYAWEYDDPRGNPVYEGQYSAIEIHWSNDTDISSEETMTVMNTNPDIELGYYDSSISDTHWVGGATAIPAINLTRGDRSEYIYIRYIGTENIEMTEQRTIQVLFAEPNGNPSYESAGITFEVRDND